MARAKRTSSRGGWGGWIATRLAVGVAAIVAISMLVFVATLVLPSDPARAVLGPDASEKAIVHLRTQLGLDRPLVIQYATWAGKALTGDFGVSLDSGARVSDLIGTRAINSLSLMASVLLISIPLSFWIGLTLARRRDGWTDRTALVGLVLLKAIPSFIVGLGLMVLLSTSVFHLFPAVSLLDPARAAFAQPAYLALPSLTLILGVTPLLTRLVRATAIEAEDADYVVAARLRGVSEQVIRWRHIAPNTLVPAVQGIAMTARVLFGGVMIVEVVYGYPGLGSLLNSAVEVRDLPVIQGIAITIAVSVIVINLIADSLTILLTPKLRTAQRPGIQPGTRANLKLTARES